MKKLLTLPLIILLSSCGSDSVSGCNVIFDFVKQDLNYPEEANHHRFDCKSEKNSDGTYTVFTFVNAENAFGVKQKRIYKYKLSYDGNNQYDLSSWSVLSKQSEEVKN